jgi:peroxiredoxin
MRKAILLTIVLFCFVLLSFLTYKIFNNIHHKNQVAQNIKTMPFFRYKTIKGTDFINTNLKKDTPTVFIYFNTECEFCQSETEQIATAVNRFKEAQLVYVSFEPIEKIKAFALKYKLNSYANIHFVCDSKMTFAETFDVKSIPTLVIYDKNTILIQKTKGQIGINKIIKIINP